MPKATRLIAGIATALLTVALASCSGGGSVVTVNGQAISHATFDKKLENNPVSRNILQQEVMNLLIDQYATQNHITITPAQIDKVENQYKAQYPPGQFSSLLKARGLTENDVRNLIRRQLVLDQAVGGNITIPESDVAAFFKKNHAAFDVHAEVKARHILVPDLATAQKIEADLKAGQHFSALAKQYSQDPGSRTKGGELGWFRRGQMVPSFEKYAFSAPIGKISPPIKSAFGYHIIQVQARKPGKKATLASAHDQIVQALRQQQEAPLVQPFLASLQQKAKIVVNDPAFASLFPTPAPLPSTAPAAPAPAAPAAPAPAATK